MTDSEDILNDLDDNLQKPRNRLYTVTLAIWAIENTVSLFMFANFFFLPGINFSSAAGITGLVIQFLTSRGLALAALFLLWRRAKSGWILTVICSMASVINMASTVMRVFRNFNLVMLSTRIAFTAFMVSFLLCAVTLVLLLTAEIRHFFSITRRQWVWTMVSGILLVVVAGLLTRGLVATLTSH